MQILNLQNSDLTILIINKFLPVWNSTNLLLHLETLVEITRQQNIFNLAKFLFESSFQYPQLVPKSIFTLENYRSRGYFSCFYDSEVVTSFEIQDSQTTQNWQADNSKFSQNQGLQDSKHASGNKNLQILLNLIKLNSDPTIVSQTYQILEHFDKFLFISQQIRFVKNKHTTLMRLLDETGLTKNNQISFLEGREFVKQTEVAAGPKKFSNQESKFGFQDSENLTDPGKKSEENDQNSAAGSPLDPLQKSKSTSSDHSFLNDFTVISVKHDGLEISNNSMPAEPDQNTEDAEIGSNFQHHNSSTKNPFHLEMNSCYLESEKCRIFSSNALPISLCYVHENTENLTSRVLLELDEENLT